ncbi:hypothetical protein HELRODRAFT_194143 [Helobdella robusta]|uniref:Uncharacterized protein n=1 Tax=Helobdella robusta TaxID=6412 RepID=T1FVR4_HELRO|nr:hypothetical protein HELRODRAFT_194143 [Helobdella robusta]ESN93359.1 hypothetical protein HELRODRAFT_194143 [Helobdella robusta]
MTSSLKSIFTKYSFNKNNNNSNGKISSLKSNNNHSNVNFDPEGGVVAFTAPADKHAVATSAPHEHSTPQSAGIKCYSQTSNDSAFSSMGCNLVDPCGVYDGDSITSLDQDGSISDSDVNKTSLNTFANCTKSHENLFDRKELFAGNILIEESPSNFNDSKLNGSHKESINSSIISIFDPTSKQCNSSLENSQTSSWMSKLTNASANLTTSSRLSLTRSTSYDTSNSNEQTEKAASLDYDDDKSKKGFRERLKKMSRNRIQPGSTKEKSKQEKHDKLVVTSPRLDISPKNYNQSVPAMELSRREVCARLPFVIAPDTDFEVSLLFFD